MGKYFNLGNYSRPVTTSVKAAQTWFDRGLIWCYAFNQEEAVRCFEKVIELDPECAMGYWGIAYAAGPFYNKPWEWYGDDERLRAVTCCYRFAARARALKSRASTLEQGLIDALCQKHPAPNAAGDADFRHWTQDYADAMRKVYRDFPNDLEVICLCAEAVMNLTPWKLWDLQLGIPAEDACTGEAIEILERGLAIVDKNQLTPHPGIVHFYLHVYEMSPTPERALPYADQLRDLCPDCGHLVHMASHIDSLCGHWQDAVDANNRAIAVDHEYLKLRGTEEFYLISVLHNHDLKMWASMFLGQFESALEAADGIRDLVSDQMMKREERYLSSTLEGYYAGRVQVLVRFGKWRQICDEALPADQALHPITTILTVYAKAIAHAAIGDIKKGRYYQALFGELYRDLPDWHIMANNPTRDILAVAQQMMNGEVEYHAGNHELGFEFLREANRLFDALEYSEPWPWEHPPRHALGALLLEQNQVDEALRHYEDDLGIGNRLPRCVQHPNNIWALHGYHECLTRLGRSDDAGVIKPRLDELIRQSDIEIKSSCCCRKS